MPDGGARAMRWLALGLCAAAALVLWPFAPWVLLAVWTAAFARRLHVPLRRRLGDRPRVAAVFTIVALAALLAPLIVLITSLVGDAIDLIDRALASDRAQDVLRQLVSGDGRDERSLSDLIDLVVNQGGRAWTIAQQLAGTAADIVIGIVVLVAGTYAILVDGDRWYEWIEAHAPIPAPALRRLADAFLETGRGLFVGIVGSGLAQSIVATVVYLVLGVPQPFALGLLTLVFSVVPAIGTAIVWVPIAAGLAMTGRPVAAIAMAIAGIAVIGTVDNLVRPYLSRRGSLQLPTYVVLVSMFGGIALLGGWGLLIGPLVVRLAKEAIALVRSPDA